MKNVLLFVGGMVTGAILLFVVLFAIGKMFQPEDTLPTTNEEVKTSLYEGFENGEIIQASSFQVFQVLEDNVALVNGYEDGFYIGPVYLLIGEEGTTFYDDQVVKVPQGSVVRMNGTYKYITNNGMDKTVPKIMILKK